MSSYSVTSLGPTVASVLLSQTLTSRQLFSLLFLCSIDTVSPEFGFGYSVGTLLPLTTTQRSLVTSSSLPLPTSYLGGCPASGCSALYLSCRLPQAFTCDYILNLQFLPFHLLRVSLMQSDFLTQLWTGLVPISWYWQKHSKAGMADSESHQSMPVFHPRVKAKPCTATLASPGNLLERKFLGLTKGQKVWESSPDVCVLAKFSRWVPQSWGLRPKVLAGPFQNWLSFSELAVLRKHLRRWWKWFSTWFCLRLIDSRFKTVGSWICFVYLFIFNASGQFCCRMKM